MKFVILLILLIGCRDKMCNKKRSIAEQINWADHNCKERK